MKKSLLAFLTLAVITSSQKVEAQCDLTVSNLQIQIVGTPVVLGPNKCEVTFNAQFDIAVNGGFKVLYFHSWLAADYPASPIFDCGNSNAQDPGTSVQLGAAVDQAGKSFMDIGFVNVPTTGALNVVQPLTFSSNFVHSPTVTLTQPANSPGLTASKYFNGTADHYTVNNIKVVINTSCASTISVKTDIWGSNSNAPDPKAQCYICALPQFFNDPSISGFKNCATPQRQYALGINTVDPTAKNVTYKVYIDMNDNGSLEPGTDELAFTSGTISISSASSFGIGPLSLPSPYSDTYPYSEKGYLILVEGPSLSNSVLDYFPHPSGCLVLPVELSSFSATRNRSNVLLKWDTKTEQNNSGFAVERNTGNSIWQEIAFVRSLAAGGNSSAELQYQYVDLNTYKGITQYRIRQIDLDNRSKYSDIRSVRGEGQPGKTVIYPNPTSNGKVNILFEEANIARDISVLDMSGRAIKILKGITSNNVVIENLTPGMYSVRIVTVATGEQVVEKIVVNKR
ncbi:MAG: T9SS type A sorting domain-containing protein [Chitinophagaceae bacterium]|nr:T9SS type A sorting domain-containing protein [Chitinophagaceae bacterium]